MRGFPKRKTSVPNQRRLWIVGLHMENQHGGGNPMFLTRLPQVHWVNYLDTCMRLECTTPMRERRRDPSHCVWTKSRSIWLVRERDPPLNFPDTPKKKGWTDVDWTSMALNSVLGNRPDWKDQAFMLNKKQWLLFLSCSKIYLCYFEYRENITFYVQHKKTESKHSKWLRFFIIGCFLILVQNLKPSKQPRWLNSDRTFFLKKHKKTVNNHWINENYNNWTNNCFMTAKYSSSKFFIIVSQPPFVLISIILLQVTVSESFHDRLAILLSCWRSVNKLLANCRLMLHAARAMSVATRVKCNVDWAPNPTYDCTVYGQCQPVLVLYLYFSRTLCAHIVF